MAVAPVRRPLADGSWHNGAAKAGGRGAGTITHLYLVRHGESLSNTEHRHCGRPPGPPLTARGRLQAAAAATILSGFTPPPSVVVSSPLLRALETAQALAGRMGASISVRHDLREVDFGAWEGLDHADLAAVPGYHAYHRDPEGHPPPGGERLSDIRVRVTRCLETIAGERAGRAVAVFSHYDPMVAFYLAVVGGDYSAAPDLSLSNGAIARFEHDGGRWRFVGVDRRAALAGAEERLEAGP